MKCPRFGLDRHQEMSRRALGSGLEREGVAPHEPDATLLAPKLPSGPAYHAMHVKIRKSSAKHKKKTGYRTRQQTKGGRKTNRRQRKRHGSF